jgi:hypothetical protein
MRAEILKMAEEVWERTGSDFAGAVIEYLNGAFPGKSMRSKGESESWKPVLAVDCDGTLLEYKKPPEFGQPHPGIIDEIRKVKAAGWHIVIWTCRNDSLQLRKHLEKHGVPFDFVNEYPYWPPDGSAKISAEVYLDDRAMAYCGSAEGLAEKILAFKPWYKRQDA